MQLTPISTLSHDMRTPLSIISMSRDMLARYFDQLSEENRQEKLNTIDHQIQFALQLLDDTVQVARGRHEFHPELVNLVSLCQISIDEIHLDKDSTHQLIFNNIGNLDMVVIDETLVSRILLNLLSNAIKYSPDGGEIRLELDSQGDWIILRVIDYGMGIDADDLPLIFDLLYRADNVGDISGTGLGLSIVKECVERHQGTITVHSEIGKGSTFTIQLPL
jgi:signal transduction histidine kinase